MPAPTDQKGEWFTGTLARHPTGLLGVVTDETGQDRIVPSGSKVSRLHIHDVGEIRYVCTHDPDGRVWEILEHRWSHDNSLADTKELKEFGVMTEEDLSEHLREEDSAEAPEGWYPNPDLSRLGREL